MNPKQKTQTLYNGEITLELDRWHRYTLNGRPVPSVTTVCGIVDKSAQLTNWAAGLASDYWLATISPGVPYSAEDLHKTWTEAKAAHLQRRELAADLGRRVHLCLESLFKTDSLSAELEKLMEDPQVRDAVTAAVAWTREHKVLKLAVERMVYSRKHGFCGTLDKLASVDGRVSLLDWKTGAGIYGVHRLQTSAYVAAYEEETGERIAQRIICHLDKEGGKISAYKFSRSEQKTDFKAFLAALRLFNTIKEIPQVRRKEKSWTESL